jgi:hypothetical protein
LKFERKETDKRKQKTKAKLELTNLTNTRRKKEIKREYLFTEFVL